MLIFLQLAAADATTLQQTTIMTNQIELVLNHKNWTNLTLRDLVESGRVITGDTKAIWEFTKAALGEPTDMEQFKSYKEIAKAVTAQLA